VLTSPTFRAAQQETLACPDQRVPAYVGSFSPYSKTEFGSSLEGRRFQIMLDFFGSFGGDGRFLYPWSDKGLDEKAGPLVLGGHDFDSLTALLEQIYSAESARAP
jgi:hypothetical protein